MGTFGSSKVAKNTTNIDARQQDNKVAAQDSNVVSTAGGSYSTTDASGQINARGNLSITQVDPNSFGFASHLIDQVFGANATTLANARAGQQSATAALGDAVERVTSAATPPAAGSSWKTWAKWGGVVAGAGVVVVLLIRALRNRRARHAA